MSIESNFERIAADIERIASAMDVLVTLHQKTHGSGVTFKEPEFLLRKEVPDQQLAPVIIEQGSMQAKEIEEAPISAPPVSAPALNLSNVDAQGMPWDPRIHSGAKSLMGSGPRTGCWKYLKGVDKSIIPTVEAELRQAVGAGESPASSAGASQAPASAAPITQTTSAPPSQAATQVADMAGLMDIEGIEDGNLQMLQGQIGLIAQKLGPRASEIAKLLSGAYGIQRISELPADKYKAFLWDCRQLLIMG